MNPQTPIPAAQYLRMSTNMQQYSLENQAAVILAYAESHGFVVVQTYADPGRTGVILAARPGLRRLLGDVLSGGVSYKAILVYDVSRWGRFQNTDESAHYEFLCTAAGVPVHYCAEQFVNDGTLSSAIMKGLKRVMAGEQSREHGERVLRGQRRQAQECIKLGGVPGYAFRRVLVDGEGKPRRYLKDGERKCVSSDKVKLVPGPPQEVEAVRLIFSLLVRRKGVSEITRILNRRGIPYQNNELWSFERVNRIVRNPKYAGWYVWGRTTRRMYTPEVRIPRAEWIQTPNAYRPIVDQVTFDKAQRFLHAHGTPLSDDALLNKVHKRFGGRASLSDTLLRKLGVRGVRTLTTRFSGLQAVYDLLGFTYPARRFEISSHVTKSRLLRNDLIVALQSLSPEGAVPVPLSSYRFHRSLYRFPGEPPFSIQLCPPETSSRAPACWVRTRHKEEKRYPALVGLIDRDFSRIVRMFIVPSTENMRTRFMETEVRRVGGVPIGDVAEVRQTLRAVLDHQRQPRYPEVPRELKR